MRLHRHLAGDKKEFILSKQLLIAGIYIGSHIKAAQESESRSVFFQEMGIALRKTSEAEYWLQLLYESDLLSKPEFDSIDADRLELKRLLRAITKTGKAQS